MGSLETGGLLIDCAFVIAFGDEESSVVDAEAGDGGMGIVGDGASPEGVTPHLEDIQPPMLLFFFSVWF